MPTVQRIVNVYMSSDSSFNKLALVVMIGDYQRASHNTWRIKTARSVISLSLSFSEREERDKREKNTRLREISLIARFSTHVTVWWCCVYLIFTTVSNDKQLEQMIVFPGHFYPVFLMMPREKMTRMILMMMRNSRRFPRAGVCVHDDQTRRERCIPTYLPYPRTILSSETRESEDDCDIKWSPCLYAVVSPFIIITTGKKGSALSLVQRDAHPISNCHQPVTAAMFSISRVGVFNDPGVWSLLKSDIQLRSIALCDW